MHEQNRVYYEHKIIITSSEIDAERETLRDGEHRKREEE
jgi:hypothetical protein